MTLRWPEPLIIADASPLIGLAKIGRLQLIRQLAREVWVPTAVWREIVECRPERSEVPVLKAALAECVREPDPKKFETFRLQADEGEAAALALAAQRPDALLLMDDQRGRRVAEREGFRYFGTLGFLLRAKREHLIESLSGEIDSLRSHGLYLDPLTIRQVLRAAGEPGDAFKQGST
jgi:predicted nucleic acid-binding protein